MQRLCQLEQAVGRTVPCAEDRCGFWHADVGVCGVAGMGADFSTSPRLASFLLALRRRIEDHADGPPHIYECLPPGLR